MSDLSDSAAEEAELQAREAFRGLARAAEERYDLTDAELCWEKERSRDGEADDGMTMAGCLGGGGGHRVAWFGGIRRCLVVGRVEICRLGCDVVVGLGGSSSSAFLG